MERQAGLMAEDGSPVAKDYRPSVEKDRSGDRPVSQEYKSSGSSPAKWQSPSKRESNQVQSGVGGVQGRVQRPPVPSASRGEAKPSKPIGPQASAKDAKEAIAQSTKGAEFSKKGDYVSALQLFTQAVALDPNLANAYQGRAYANAMTGSLDGAIRDYTSAIP